MPILENKLLFELNIAKTVYICSVKSNVCFL